MSYPKENFLKKETDEFSQIILDEAQDFGETVYYVLRQVLPRCYFTIMGDVSQNIRYETGLNDWEDLKKILLRDDRDSFYLLAKSYRNTIEISQYAGRVLEKPLLGIIKYSRLSAMEIRSAFKCSKEKTLENN